MKLLVFSHIHRDQARAERLVELAHEADVVVGAGDDATMRMGLEGTIEILSAIETPTVLVPGNAENDVELCGACASWPSARVLHGQALDLAGAQFFGLAGGVPPTRFPWSFDLDEDDAAAADTSISVGERRPGSGPRRWSTSAPRVGSSTPESPPAPACRVPTPPVRRSAPGA
jgi:Icc-related predicted phosphoesterase